MPSESCAASSPGWGSGVEIGKQPVLDGTSLVPLIDGESEDRSKAIGFWDASRPGIGTPSAKWMGELLDAQKKGEDLAPHSSSLNAAKLPDPKVPNDRFSGHAAWIEGDWKLHRIEKKGGTVSWELYNPAKDRAEENNPANVESAREKTMQADLKQWLRSVVGSLNGEEY